MLRSIRRRLRREARPPGPRGDWERKGLVGPFAILSRRDAVRIGREFNDQYERSGIATTRNRHVDLPVLAELCVRPGLWETAHALLGDELLLWRTNMFLGNPDLPWHEDHHARLFAAGTFSLSMLLAIEDSPPDNCPVFVPGSHRLTVAEKELRYGITARNQTSGNVRYEGRIGPEFCKPVALDGGQAIVFHPALLHASSGFVNGKSAPSKERMSITFRLASSTAELRDEAFPEGPEERDLVLHTIRRPLMPQA